MAIKLIHGDCLDILPTLEAGSVDAVITDPPYGIQYDTSHDKYKNGIARKEATWDILPFDPRHLLRFEKIIMWGANCYSELLPTSPVWIAWIKTTRNRARVRQADFEMAWTRNCITRPQAFRHLWIGAYRDSENGKRNQHPTQKPIAVMEWCIELCNLKAGAVILDPYMGSGTTGIAAINKGIDFIGIEIDADYFKIAQQRISDAESRMNGTARKVESNVDGLPLFE